MFKIIKKFRPLVYLLMPAIFMLVFTGLSCGKSTTTDTTAEESTETTSTTTQKTDLSNIDPSTVNQTFQTNFTQAKTKAIEWKSDAKIVNFTIKLPTDLSQNNATETYVFGSGTEQVYWWVFSLSEASGKYLRALIPKTDYLGNTLTAINEKYWKTNYLQAFQKADLYQGSAFRAANPNTEVTISLSNGDPKGWLWWLVEYKSPTGNSLKIRINPNDLTIVDDLGNIITTGATSTTSTTGGTATGTSTTPSTTGGTATGTTGTSSTTPTP